MSGKSEKMILDFSEISKEDTQLVGGKNANLGEMTNKTKVPIPPGYAITAKAYRYFVEKSGAKEKFMKILKKIDAKNIQDLEEKAAQVRKIIEKSKIPKDLEKQILEEYHELKKKLGLKKPPLVAVRSSATAEDLPGASFAGQQETYLDVEGDKDLLEKIRMCFASLFTARAIAYREEKGFPQNKVYLSVAVQKMVNSKISGVMFSLNPATGDRKVVLIEGTYGLGEFVVQGKVTPDRYILDKKTLEIEKHISDKKTMLVGYGERGVKEKPVPQNLRKKQAVPDKVLKELAGYAMALEEHYDMAQDMEWASDLDTGKTYIVQSRPETVWSERKKEEQKQKNLEEGEVLLQGLGASPGTVGGKAQVILGLDKIGEFKDGEILVTEMTSPDWVPAMRKAKAIITDAGGMTCHAAIVSRELGVPCIVGSGDATKRIKTGDEITVDATRGVVYKGIVEEKKTPEAAQKIVQMGYAEEVPITGVKVYCNLGVPEKAEEVAALPVDGVGLMREEFVIATTIGKHPLKMIEEGKSEEYVNMLAAGIGKVAKAFYPRPVVLRFSDFKTNEYRQLKGGEKYENEEDNPMLGFRGASRYIDKDFEPAFRLEIKAVKKVREEKGAKNLHVMVPFCRTVEELKKVLSIMKSEDLERNEDFKVWLMCEIPSNIILVDQFSQYVDGYSIGSNDLTQLTLGVDRDSEKLSETFDERNLAVKRFIHYFVKKAHRCGCTVSICGQAPSEYDEYIDFLVRSGIDSISVNPDKIVAAKKKVAQIEERVLLEEATHTRLKLRENLGFDLGEEK